MSISKEAWAEDIRARSALEGDAERQGMAAWLASLPVLAPIPTMQGDVVAVLVKKNRSEDGGLPTPRRPADMEENV